MTISPNDDRLTCGRASEADRRRACCYGSALGHQLSRGSSCSRIALLSSMGIGADHGFGGTSLPDRSSRMTSVPAVIWVFTGDRHFWGDRGSLPWGVPLPLRYPRACYRGDLGVRPRLFSCSARVPIPYFYSSNAARRPRSSLHPSPAGSPLGAKNLAVPAPMISSVSACFPCIRLCSTVTSVVLTCTPAASKLKKRKRSRKVCPPVCSYMP